MTRFLDSSFDGLSHGMVFAAVALALVLIWRATRIVNFAQGGMAMVTTFLASTLTSVTGSYWLSFVLALLAGLVLGAVIERVLIRRILRAPALNAVIVTFGLLICLQSAAGLIWGAQNRSLPLPFSARGLQVGHTHLSVSHGDLFVLAVVAVVFVLLTVLFRFTGLGLAMRASAFEPEVARLLGVRVGRMLTLGWALAAVAGSLAGLLFTGALPDGVQLNPAAYDAILVYGFTAAVLGGLDSPGGAVVGGLLTGFAYAYAGGYLGSDLALPATVVLLLVVLMARPQGLFSRAAARRV